MPTESAPARHSRFEPDEPCRNCGDPTRGNYCPACGQAKREAVASVRAMLADVLEDQFVVNPALPRTLEALVLRPGLLTREYLAGRRATYVAPFRLYLASSVLFFLVFSVFGLRALERGASTVDAQVEAVTAALDSARGSRPDSASPPAGATSDEGPPTREIQPWARNLRVNLGSAETSARVRARTLERWGHLPFQEALRAFMGEYLRYAPQTVFVLLPLFALILRGLYLGSGRFYAEHFVFSLHVHAFAFLAALVGIALGWAVGGAVVGPVLALHLWLALKRVYGQGPFVTSLKFLALGTVYGFVLLVAFTSTIILTFLRL